MKNLKLKLEQNRKIIISAINMFALIAIMVFMITSVRNIVEIVLNFKLIMANSNIINAIINTILYLLVVTFGFQSIRKSKNSNYIIVTLLLILIVY